MSLYTVGEGSAEISLLVDIDTIGLAASRATVVNIHSSQPAIAVAHSLNATGDIPQATIGAADSLITKRLSILTKIDLIGNDTEANKIESERITARYILDNGNDGHQIFRDAEKTVSDDYSSIVLYKFIDLI